MCSPQQLGSIQLLAAAYSISFGSAPNHVVFNPSERPGVLKLLKSQIGASSIEMFTVLGTLLFFATEAIYTRINRR